MVLTIEYRICEVFLINFTSETSTWAKPFNEQIDSGENYERYSGNGDFVTSRKENVLIM